MLQQILDEKKKREMVEVYGITLERTKQFYAEKIQEYNDIIDLKHLQKKRLIELPKQKRGQMIRFPGDDGKITNFHISINSQNLNPLFNELSKRENRSHSTQLEKIKIKNIDDKKRSVSIMDSSQVINSKILSKSTKISRVPTRKPSILEEKLCIFDKQNLMLESVTIDEIQQTNQQSSFISRKNNEPKKSIKFSIKNPINEEPKPKISERISESIRESFNCKQEELVHSTSEDNIDCNRKSIREIFNQNNTLIVKPDSTQLPSISVDVVPKFTTQLFPDIYKDINFGKRKAALERRKYLIQNQQKIKQPKFLHICGSKFPVPNNDQNWNDYKNLKIRLLEKQLQNELEKLKSQKEQDEELYDLTVLQGPPKYVKYQSTNLKQDYTDIKITKILQKLAQERDP